MKKCVVFTLAILAMLTAAQAEVKYHPLTGRPMMLTVEGVSREHGTPAVSAKRAEQFAREFLEVNGSVFGVKDIASELVMVPVEQDRYGFSHVNFFQVHEGVEVIGGALYVHLNRKGEVTSVNGKFAPGLLLATTPAIEKEQASKLALAQAQMDMQTTDSPIAGEPRLVLLPLGFIQNEKDDDVHLAWQVVADEEVSSQSMTYYIDAQTGATLIGLDNVKYINRWIYDCAMTSTWNCDVSTYGRLEGGVPRGPCQIVGFAYGSNDVDSAYAMVGICHDFVLQRYGLNGANNQGGIGNPPFYRDRTSVRANANSSWQAGCQNGIPNGRFNGTTGRLDICLGTAQVELLGHEYGHAIQFSAVTNASENPVGLQTSGESNALGEGGADIWGVAFKSFYVGVLDWLHMFSRNIEDPESQIDDLDVGVFLPYPDRHFSDGFYCGTFDGGGGHHNSTVFSHACYRMVVGGEHNGCEMDSIGMEAVEQILYRATAEYFTPTETFAEAVLAFQQSCIDLYDATHPEYLATVTAALQAVEMDQPGRCSGIAEVAPACAVHGAGAVTCDTVVALGANVMVEGMSGLAGREVTYYLSAHPAVDTIWAPINIYHEVMNRDTVELDGSLMSAAWHADTLGLFDLIVDENSDGFYQPWADTILTIQVIQGAVQDLTAMYSDPARVELRWRAFAGATSYVIEADSLPDFAAPVTIGTVADTVFTDSVSVGSEALRVYRVRAVW